LGVYGFDDATRRMKLLALHPGVTVDQVCEASEFEIIIPEKVDVTQEPTDEQLRILHEIDPRGMVIGK
jgi:glutaconate CoA-transferase subunit B